jgi:hypothetical protein
MNIHIVGLDNIHKSIFKKKHINSTIIDLDSINKQIESSDHIIHLKKTWNELNTILQKQSDIVKKNNIRIKRENIQKSIHTYWKNEMIKYISVTNAFFLGNDIYHKDYRVKIELPNVERHIFVVEKSETYAKNQIKYFVHRYENEIIEGSFPIRLLDNKYNQQKYIKLFNHYTKRKYELAEYKDIINVQIQPKITINDNAKVELVKNNKSTTTPTSITNNTSVQINMHSLNKISTHLNTDTTKLSSVNNSSSNITSSSIKSDEALYIVLPYKTNIIPVQSSKPLIAFETKEKALKQVRSRKYKLSYVYKLNKADFTKEKNSFITRKSLVPLDDESIFMT